MRVYNYEWHFFIYGLLRISASGYTHTHIYICVCVCVSYTNLRVTANRRFYEVCLYNFVKCIRALLHQYIKTYTKVMKVDRYVPRSTDINGESVAHF